MSLADAIWLDLFAVSICIVLLLARGNLRHSHPGVLYLVFHIFVFSVRAIAVANGAPTFLKIPESEIARAMNYADIFLVCFVVGLIATPEIVSKKKTRSLRTEAKVSETQNGKWLELDNKYIRAVSIVALPIGIATFLRHAFIPGAASSDSVVSTAYSTLALTWPGLLLLILIYRNGFRLWLMIPMSVYLTVMAVQGFGRFRLILPAILLFQIWLDRRDRKWPRLGMVALIVALTFVFFPLKDVGTSLREGASVSEVKDVVEGSFSSTASGESDDQSILDQLAITLALTDSRGKTFYGRPYVNFLVLPIPRVIWPEKPGLADHIEEISTPSRPLGTIGGVTTIVGDLYLNFSLIGLTLGAFILGRLSGGAFRRAYASSFLSMQRVSYLIFASSLVQIARDGLISLPVFVFLQTLPLVAIILLHRRGSKREHYVRPEHRQSVENATNLEGFRSDANSKVD